MIHFQDISEQHQNIDLPSTVDFRDIKPESGFMEEDPHKFWDTVFDAKLNQQDIAEFDEELIFAEIFGRLEDEFAFDFAIDETLSSAIDQFSVERWEYLSDAERVGVVSQFSEVLAERLGLERTPEIRYFDGPENHCGHYDLQNNSINLNIKLFADPQDLFNTVAHELRHAYQHERSEVLETWTDMLYKVNFDNYISPVSLADGKHLFFTDYQDQLVEAEARAFADLFTGKEAPR